MENCLFCKIIKGEIPAEKVFENEKVLAFKDISPAAKIHILFIHKVHSENIVDLFEQDSGQVMDIFQAITTWTKEQGLDQSGFRIINNCGKDGGQTVFHTHFHVLGGQSLNPGLN